VVVADGAVAAALIDAGVCERVAGPARALVAGDISAG